MLFCALSLVAGASFVGCKDYDDDIKNLQSQIDGKVTPEQLQEKISAMESSLSEAKSEAAAAKSSAEAAKAAAEDAKTKAEAANDAAAAAAADAAAAKADVELAASEAKKAAVEAAEAKVEAMKPEVQKMVDDALAGKVNQADLEALATKVSDLEAEISAIIGHRLTSIAFIPETNINGIPAIKFYSLSYVPQAFNAGHTENQETTIGSGSAVTVSTKETTVSYRLNPRMGVRPQDITLPSFDCIVSTNEISTTRGVNSAVAGVNSPIAPVADQALTIVNGVLQLKVTKTVTDNINREWLIDQPNVEKFYMASLNVPIAQTSWTKEETAANAPTVHSEYVRIAESTVTPMLKQFGSLAVAGHDLNAVDANGKYIHYHDSTTLYKTGVDQLIDHKVKWNATIDLKKLVDVCTKENDHASLANYKAYGLTYRFALATKAYMQGSNNTDQQQFALIDSPMNGKLTSKTYTIGGVAQTAVGREPIVRAMLVDTVNNKLVAQRYIKLQFVKDVTPSIDLPVYAFENDTVTCHNLVNVFGTQQMNELIYRQIGENGMTKKDFHEVYKTMEILSLTKDGVDILKAPLTWTTDAAQIATNDIAFVLVPDALDNTSYNLNWYMTPKAVGKIVPARNAVYVIKVAHKDPTGLNGDVTKTYKLVVDVPNQAFKYQGTYWQTGAAGKIFNVNPIVYNTQADGTLQNPTNADHATHTLNDYSHIEADLVNGYLYGATSEKPANLAQFIAYIRECADVRVEFDSDKFANYAHLAGYVVNSTKDELWKTAVGTINPKADYSQDDNSAATIANAFGATALENQKNLPWNFNETLGSTTDEATSVIRLSETADKLNGTPAAKALVGKKVPVRLVVEYNSYNVDPVQEFEVFFINPLTVDAKIGDRVQDAVIDGSYVDVEKGLTFTDWNNYAVAKKDIVGGTGKQGYAHTLWHYYNVQNVVFDVKNVTTNLAWENNVYVPKDGVMDGKLPTGRSLKQVTNPGANYVEVTENPTHLGYFNNDGTPVNLDYKMFMTVKVTYKWGELAKPNLELGVIRADGTPDR